MGDRLAAQDLGRHSDSEGNRVDHWQWFVPDVGTLKLVTFHEATSAFWNFSSARITIIIIRPYSPLTREMIYRGNVSLT